MNFVVAVFVIIMPVSLPSSAAPTSLVPLGLSERGAAGRTNERLRVEKEACSQEPHGFQLWGPGTQKAVPLPRGCHCSREMQPVPSWAHLQRKSPDT